MKLYLFNLTDRSLFVRPEYSKYELSVLPNAFVTFPASGDNFILSSAVGSPGSLTPEAERQHVVNLKKPFRWNHISMPEDCPWRIHCDQASRKRVDILILPKRPTESFLSDVPDTTPLYSLCLPGKFTS